MKILIESTDVSTTLGDVPCHLWRGRIQGGGGGGGDVDVFVVQLSTADPQVRIRLAELMDRPRREVPFDAIRREGGTRRDRN